MIETFTKLCVMNTSISQKKEEITCKEIHKALQIIMFLKEKRDGEVCRRTCGDGSVQRGLCKKVETSSPIIATESVLLTAVIDTFEKERDMAVLDIPSTYLHTGMKDLVYMNLTGKWTELLVTTVPGVYRPCVTYGPKREAVLYVKLHKALYGYLKSTLLFHEKLVGDFKSIGF